LGRRCDALAAIAVIDRRLDQLVETLKHDGVPTFSLLNDFAQGLRRNYIGLNTMKVGRDAAWTITQTCPVPGKLAIFVGGNRWHGHDLREVGFRAFARERAPAFAVLDTLVNLETRQLTCEATRDLLTRHADLRGIYVAGGDMAGAIAALRETRAPGEVALVVNEVTQESRAALLDGYLRMIISTPMAELCDDVVARVVQSRLGNDGIIGQHFLDPRIILPELA
jgi:LacI family transcriptional regulator